MPKMYEVLGAVPRIIRDNRISRDTTPGNLDVILRDVARHPHEYGMYRGPNWDYRTILEAVCREVWGKPIHPARIAPCWRYLPNKILSFIYNYSYSPSLISNTNVSNKEATEWLIACSVNRQYGGQDWRAWLGNFYAWKFRHVTWIPDGFRPRTQLIANWIINKKDSSYFARPIRVYGPQGLTYSFLPGDRIDEIQDADLTEGIRTSPARAFERAAERLGEAAQKKLAQDLTPFPGIEKIKDTQSIRVLKNSHELVLAGRKFANCVAGYAPACKAGQIFILEINGTSLAEIDARALTILQHRAKSNDVPPDRDIWALNDFLAGVKKGKEE